jgi:hypothetical protein
MNHPHAVPTLLAWTPFIGPIPHPGPLWWLLMIPLVVGVAVIWKAVRLPSLERYWVAVAVMALQVFAGVAALGLGLLLLVRWLVPLLPVE